MNRFCTAITLCLIWRSTLAATESLCDGERYNEGTHLCCDDVKLNKKTGYEKCCGSSSYDSRTHRCDTRQTRQLSIQESMKCHANGTIELTNDEPDAYQYASAMQGTLTSSSQICSVDMSNNPEIIISGCNPNKEVMLFLSAVDLSTNILGGQDTSIKSVKLYCTIVPQEGINITVGHVITAESGECKLFCTIVPQEDTNVIVGHVITAEVTTPTAAFSKVPKIFMESKMWYTETNEFTNYAQLGQQLTWGLKAPDGYSALPVTCTAYSGTTTGGRPSKVLIENGCSTTDNLVGDFIVLEDLGIYGLCAQLWVFSFYNSPNVYFHCTVKVCPSGSPSCNYTCGDRKRRHIDENLDNSKLMETGLTLHIVSGASHIDGVSRLVGISLAVTLRRFTQFH